MQTEVRPLAVTMSEAARLAGVSRPTIYRWAKLDGFPVLHLGGVTRVMLADFVEWLKDYGGAK